MPVNKNALTRIMLLDKWLSDRYHSYSVKDMKEMLEKELPQYGHDKGVTIRCVQKDIEYLEYKSPFDVEFERYTIPAYSPATDKTYTKRCIRYADPTFSIFKGKLSDEEKGILSTALSTLGSFEGFEQFEWLADLKRRLNLKKSAPIVQISKNITDNSTLIAQAFCAISNRSVIKLYYKKYTDSVAKEIIISPYLIKEYNCRWYIIGGAYDTGKILNFALDRVKGLEVLTGHRYMEAPDDWHERYEEIVGVTFYENEPLREIIFWADDNINGFIETKPIHGSQKPYSGERELEIRSRYPNLEGGSFFSIECRKNYELIRELCSFGGCLHVLSPKEIVEDVKQRIRTLKDAYEL